MSSEPVISVRGLSKTYRVYDHPLHGLLSRLSGDRIGRRKEYRALEDLSFDVGHGETVGIIGRNGSGKSTLLQLICGIRKATVGSVRTHGRVSALLELGSGFHPEFTGRENVFLQGAIAGFSRPEMESRFDHIVAFADIGEFIDQPVRLYSSGMFVRLAFAVSVEVAPDILVIDEALSVGDIDFQAKCLTRMRELMANGVTTLFVSHSMQAVNAYCTPCAAARGRSATLRRQPGTGGRPAPRSIRNGDPYRPAQAAERPAWLAPLHRIARTCCQEHERRTLLELCDGRTNAHSSALALLRTGTGGTLWRAADEFS
jgi:ABC-type polysaccharide/polyol phosphate transport system ATPase subunit